MCLQKKFEKKAQKKKGMDASEAKWMWISISLVIVFLVAALVIVVIATTGQSTQLPKDIDVILLDRNRGLLKAQLKAVKKYMGWCKRIRVMSLTESGEIDGVTYTKLPAVEASQSVLDVAFIATASVDGISDHAIFLADYAIPFRSVPKSYLFYGTRPRLFNYFRDTAEEVFFTSILKYDLGTLPTFVYHTPTVKLVNDDSKLATVSAKINQFIFQSVTEERVVVRNDMNREIFIDATLTDNADIQFAKLGSVAPVFATFHPKNEGDALALTVTLLNKHFGV